MSGWINSIQQISDGSGGYTAWNGGGLEDYDGTNTLWEDDNQSTTRGTPTTQPTAGARVVSIALLDFASSAAQCLYVVFNATNDADANSKLGAAGSRYVVALNERRVWTFPKGSECTRIDYLTNAAETGTNKVAGEYVI